MRMYLKRRILSKILFFLLNIFLVRSVQAEIINGFDCYIEETLCVPISPPLPDRDDYIKDEILLSITEETPKFIYYSIMKNYGLDETESISLMGTELKVAKTNGHDPLELAQKLNSIYFDLESATNNIYKLSSGFESRNARLKKNSYPKSLTGAQKALAISKGQGVLIGMIDGPVDRKHKALKGKLTQINHLVDINNGSVANLKHGTAIAGILVGRDPQIGIAPKARLLSIPAFEYKNNHFGSSSSLIANAIGIAIEKKVDVLNLSFAGSPDKIVKRMIEKAINKGIIVVASCGNDSAKIRRYPAAIPKVLAVTAVDHSSKIYKKANSGNYIDLSAPGVGVLTTAPGNRYQIASGTSLSTANVSGSLALVLSASRQKRKKMKLDVFYKTVKDLGAEGKDNHFGYGLVNVYKALKTL